MSSSPATSAPGALTRPPPIAARAATDPALPAGPWWQIKALATPEGQPSAAEILIYGDIGESWDGESVTAAAFLRALDRLDAEELTVRINSYGGSVSDGLAIHNALQRKRKDALVTIAVDGVAASSASMIAMAGDTVALAANALLMIHAPWGMAVGNAVDMRDMAATLDRYAQAMAHAYARNGFSAADALPLLQDGQDHWYTAEEAKALGLIDRIDAAAPVAAQVPARYRPGARHRFLSDALAKPDPAAGDHLPDTGKMVSAVHDHVEDTLVMVAQASHAPAASPVPVTTFPVAADSTLSAPTGAFTEVLPMSDPGMNPSAPSVAEITATAAREARAALAERNGQLKARCDAFLAATPAARAAEVRGCYEAALADPDQTADGFTAAVLAKLAEQPAEPIAGAYQTRATAGEDQRDKLMTACADALLARAAVRTGKPVDLNGNPFRGKTLARIAEDSLVRGGTRVDGLDPMRIVALAFTQSTSDFPVLMENVMHKALLAGYNVAADTWRRWCAVGSVSDFRAHNRYMLGSIGDLTEVGEGGEFQNASIPDGRKQSVTIGTRGQILTLTRQAIINDDLGAFVGLAEARGRAAARTVENAVYTAMGLNGGYGPTLSDGKTIIHSDHGNIANTSGAPSVASVESGILTMAAQKDISGHDYLDLRPSILLVPIGLDMTARVLNTSANDPAATGSSKNFLTPNPYQGYFADIVSSQRLEATKWYMLASPSVAPVLEVSFLNGVQEPVMEMETGFTVDGVSWKTRLDFGVSGVGYEGIVYNAGQ